MKFLKSLNNICQRVAVVAAATLVLVSCDALYEDLDPCPPTGAVVKFVYDYNMEFADAFPAQVDCISLYVYDSDGNNISVVTDTSEELAKSGYSIPLELPAGNYKLVAHGGLACEHTSFAPLSNLETGHHHTDMSVKMLDHCLTNDEHRNLHRFFYGSLDIEIATEQMEDVTVKLMRNTNDIQIALQHIHGSPVDVNDFNFAIYDDNILFRHDNEIIPSSEVKYTPWATANRATGTVDNVTKADGQTEVQVALAELSVSRLVTYNRPRLHVTRASDNSTVIDIPLINYMLLYKSHNISNMSDQEYLDRENQWNFLFFLDETRNDLWLKNMIQVNDWIVRINDVNP